MNVLIINTHEPYPFSEGKLSAALVDIAVEHCQSKGYNIRQTKMKEQHNIDEELEKHTWCNTVILQIPVNWMSVSWSNEPPRSKLRGIKLHLISSQRAAGNLTLRDSIS